MRQGGEDQQDALSCRSLSAKQPLIIGLFCRKRPIKIRQPVGLRHPVPPTSPVYMGRGGLVLIGRFLQKSPIISGSFAERDLQLKASCASSLLYFRT